MNKRNIIYPAIIFGLLSSLFFFGSFSKDYELEKNAKEIAEVARNARNSDLQVLGVKVEAANNAKLPDAEAEYRYLYEAFRLDNYATYAPVGNSNKEIEYKIEGIVDAKPLSFFRFDYAESIPSGNYFRHKRYPIQLMFEDKPFYDQGYSNVIAISVSQAKALLKAKGIEEPVIDDYKSLTLNADSPSPLNLIKGDGSKYECYIGNIYSSSSKQLYYSYINEIIDNFVISYKTLPSDVKNENLYFLNKYSYQNKYFMNHINDVYKNKSDYKLSIVRNNLQAGINEEALLHFYYGSIGHNNWVAILVTTLASLGCVAIVFLSTTKDKLYKSKLFNILFIVSLLLPYLIFWIINAITKSILFFSWFSTTANIVVVLSLILIYLLSIGIHKLVVSKKKENINNESKN